MAMNRDAEWLRQRYVVDGMDCVQIGAEVGRDAKTVWAWLKKCGIPTRPRGSNAATNLLRNGRPPGFKLSDAQKASLRAARLADGHFPKAADGSPYWKGKSGPEHPSWLGGASPERQAFYASEEWRSVRKRAYTRAHGRCERCGGTERLHIHHVYPFVIKHLRAQLWNLRVLCRGCHLFVHSNRNGDREFLPLFGVYRYPSGRTVPMSYRPKVKMTLPAWLQR